ncbi:MAG: PQQ-dependent sugar dehydrogenase [Gemmatimonadaceae bacterium]|nr:PQQ-dependent sugar dehydrogenase [Chitinophagaceae bacterium]
MYKLFFGTVATVAVLFVACGNNSNNQADVSTNETAAKDTSNPSVETKKPNAKFKPAFAGQTRIAAVKTRTLYEGKLLSSDLKSPWGIAALPDGRFIITQKRGEMRIATNSGTVGAAITGIPEVNAKGQGGLLGIAVDPGFAQNRMLYWSFSENSAEGNLTAIAKGKLSADEKSIQNATVIYRATPGYKGTLHYGGRILIDKAGNLIISTGERSDIETRPQAQDVNSGLGKVIRITKDGKAAAGNPMASSARPEIYSYGHRNVQGLALHPVTGELWENEFGPRGGDELNLVKPGKNYGWPVITYGIEYSGSDVPGAIAQKAGMEQPVYYWDPVISPSGMTFYNSDVIAEWKNNLFISSLSGTHVIRLVIRNNKVVGEERLLADQGERFRDITQGKDGALYAVTDGGKLYRIGKK